MSTNDERAKDAEALAVLDRADVALLGEGYVLCHEVGKARAHLAARLDSLAGEVDRAWAAANRAEAKVRGWEATVVCTNLPVRAFAVDGWGPGADGNVQIPQITPEKLADIIDRLAAAERERDALREEAAYFADGSAHWQGKADEWRERAETAEAELARLREWIELAKATDIRDPSERFGFQSAVCALTAHMNLAAQSQGVG